MHRVTRTLLSLAGTVLLILLAGAAQANTLHVPSQYASIQAAITAANSGDTILVAAGTYHESLSWAGKDLTLQGAGAGQSLIDPSAANGGPGGRCLYTQSLTAASLLEGFTLQNGSDGTYGGGMYNTSSSPAVTNCTFSGNAATYGGGMYNDSSSPAVTNCTFNANLATDGGGMHNLSSSPTMTNCTFTANSARYFGSGGGIFNTRGSNPKLTNCILWGNSARVGGGLFNMYNSNPTVTYSDVQDFGNTTPDANHNFGADPLFVSTPSPGPDGKWGTADDDYGDLRLQFGSPGFNAGNNAVVTAPPFPTDPTNTFILDLAGNQRINGGTVDLGAYELWLPRLTLLPTTVPGGSISWGTVYSFNPLGYTVSLMSSNPAVATVPDSVTVPAGAYSATFPVSTTGVVSTASVTISAGFPVGTDSASLRVVPASLLSVNLLPATVTGGLNSTGGVVLNGVAPPGGYTVSLQSSDPALATVPSSVTVPAGASFATFTVTTSPVTSNQSAAITADPSGDNRSASLLVVPAALRTVTVDPASGITGGQTATGNVFLTGPAAADFVVPLSSSNPSVASVPSSVTVPAGKSTAAFAVTTSAQSSDTSVTITADPGGANLGASLLVKAPPPTNLVATPGNAQVTLTWSASAGASSYNVYKATVSGGPYTAIARYISLKPVVDYNVLNGITYYYVVTANRPAGESLPSNQASATPNGSGLVPPAPPSNLVATPGNGQVTLTWSASAGATTYNVYRSTSSGGPYVRIQRNISLKPVTDTAVTNGITYYYVVTANGLGGESGYSNEASTTPGP